MESWDHFQEDVSILVSALEQARAIPAHLRAQSDVHHTDMVLSAAEQIYFPALRLKLLERMEVEDLSVWNASRGHARRSRLDSQQGMVVCDRIYRFLPEVADRGIVVGAQRLIGEYCLEAGHFSEARGPLEDALQAAVEAGDEEYVLSCRILLVRCMAGQGKCLAAREALEEAKALGRLLLEQR